MTKFSLTSLRKILSFWFLLLALAPLLLAILITYNVSSQTYEQRTFDKLTAIRDLKVGQVENWINERKGDFKIFIQNTDPVLLNAAITTPDEDQTNMALEQSIRDILHNYQKAYGMYEEIYILNSHNGQVDISTNISNEGNNEKETTFFPGDHNDNKISISPVYYSPKTGKNLITLSAPIYDNWNVKPEVIGVLVANIDLSHSLYPLLLNRTGLGKTGETLIVNKEGIALNELRGYQNAPLHLQITAEPAINASQGKTGIIKSTDYIGNPVLAAYTYIPETEWGFVCKQDLSELNQPINSLGYKLILILILSAIIVIIIIYFVSNSIAEPIIKMNLVAQKIGKGDFSVRNTISSIDELGALALAFNNMTEETHSRFKIQQGLFELSSTMVDKTNINEFALSLVKQLMKITGANMGAFYVLNDVSMEYEHFLSIGANSEAMKPFSAEHPEGDFGNVLADKSIHFLKEIPHDTIFKYRTIAGEAVPREMVSIPLLIDNIVVAIISVASIKSFHPESYEIIKQSWNNINASYSSIIASERTRIFAELLSQTNQQLEAQSEELQSQSEELQSQSEELQHTAEELHEQNIELELQKEQVETANKLKTEFLSNMSHELRTPLNSIMALSRVLISQTDQKLDEEESSYLEIIERNGKRLLTLINDILDLSKIEAGKMDINPESISVKSMLITITDSTRALANQKGINLNLFVPDDLPKIETDEAKLHQVLLNIVGNAIKFTEQGSVDLSAQYDEQYLYIEVQDSGIGISAEDLPYIFDEFRQADGSSTRRFEGTGLGLAIAKKLVGILGGSISVQSKIGKGSHFTVKIPINWYEKQNETNLKNYKSVANSAEEIGDSSFEITVNEKPHDKKRILIIDDNGEAVVQIKKILENENYMVDVAIGGQEALDYIQRIVPDGIILDLMMPVIDGFEVLNKIRSTAKTKTIPVIVLTAKDLTKEELSILNANHVQQLLQKGNVDIETLLQQVDSMFGKQQTGLSTNESREIPNVTSESSILKNEEGNLLSVKSSRPRILVIEDNTDNLITLKALLKSNYNLLFAFNGEEGLKIAREQKPDLILLDISLPKMSGEEVVQLLKKEEKTGEIPVIAITAQAMKGDKEKLLNLGCNGYVPKPIDQEELLNEINKWVEV